MKYLGTLALFAVIAFDAAAVGTLLGGAGALVTLLAAQECDPFLSDV